MVSKKQILNGLITLFFIFGLFVPAAYAINYPNKPNDKDFYVDDANIISAQGRDQINFIIGQLWHEIRRACARYF